jgi:hypothetical protein
LKGAFINQEIYIGDNLLDSLVAIKSKEEVIGEIIGLLQSPAQTSYLQLLKIRPKRKKQQNNKYALNKKYFYKTF